MEVRASTNRPPRVTQGRSPEPFRIRLARHEMRTQPPNRKTISVGVFLLGIAVLAVAAFARRVRLLEQLYLWRLDSEDVGKRRMAAKPMRIYFNRPPRTSFAQDSRSRPQSVQQTSAPHESSVQFLQSTANSS